MPGQPLVARATLLETISAYRQSNIDPVSRERDLWDKYGETVALMVLDSTGFSRVSASHGIVHCLSNVVAMRGLCEPVCYTHHCLAFHGHADNIYAVFPHVTDALSCALSTHQEINRSGLMLTETEPFRVGIGIGYGRMLFGDGLEGYFASEMNILCKLGEDLAAGGETLLTENAYHHSSATLHHQFEQARLTVSGMELTYFRHSLSQ